MSRESPMRTAAHRGRLIYDRAGKLRLLLGRIAELLFGLRHGGLKILACLRPPLVAEGHGAFAHSLALILARMFAASAESSAVAHAFAFVGLGGSVLRLAGAVVLHSFHFAGAGWIQPPANVRLLQQQ